MLSYHVNHRNENNGNFPPVFLPGLFFLTLILSINMAEAQNIHPDKEPKVIKKIFPIINEKPNGLAERVYFFYEDPEVARNSYAAVDIGCSGTMIGPNIMMTAAHCNHFLQMARFRVYPELGQPITEAYQCQYILHTFPDMDLNLYWCAPNDRGENPGDKFGYVDFDISIDPATGFNYQASRELVARDKEIYSIWMNPIQNLGNQSHSIYSRGRITDPTFSPHWGSPNAPIGPFYLCGSDCPNGVNGISCNVARYGGAQCDGGPGDCSLWRPMLALGIKSDVWARPGASGSPQFSQATHRLLIGPNTIGSGGPDGGPDRTAVGIADHLKHGTTDQTLFRANGCFTRGTIQINENLLQTLELKSPSSYYGLIDKNRDGLFDVQRDLERVRGENSRGWYWLGFESHRRNMLWSRPIEGVVSIDSRDPAQGIAFINAFHNNGEVSRRAALEGGYVTVLSHASLNLSSSQFYRISFKSANFHFNQERPIRVCLEGQEVDCAEVSADRLRNNHVVRLRGTPDSSLKFKIQSDAMLRIQDVTIVADTQQMDFDSHDKRYVWRDGISKVLGRIWPNGRNSSSQVDWAGVAYRNPQKPMLDDWTLVSNKLAIDGGGTYKICFDHSSSVRDSIQGDIAGVVRIENEFGQIQGSRSSFRPEPNWTKECTSSFYIPTDDNALQFGIEAREINASGSYLIDNLEIVREKYFIPWEKQNIMIVNKATGKCLTVKENVYGIAEENVFQNECRGMKEQIWNLDQREGIVKSAKSGSCLRAKGGAPGNIGNVTQYNCQEREDQKWSFTLFDTGKFPDATLQIRSKHSNKCVEVENLGTVYGVNVQQGDCRLGSSQGWVLSPVVFQIIN